MFKKKPIYIIGIILFTLILIADLALYFLIPRGFDREDMGGFGGGKPGGGFASGNSSFDSLDGSNTDDNGNSGFDAFGGGSVKDKGDFGGMPPDRESSDFTMPEGVEIPEDMTPPEGMEMPEGMPTPEGMEMPEGFDPSENPGRGLPGGTMTVLSSIRSAFWPVLVVCILGDGLCIFMLIRISRKKKALAMQTLHLLMPPKNSPQ